LISHTFALVECASVLEWACQSAESVGSIKKQPLDPGAAAEGARQNQESCRSAAQEAPEPGEAMGAHCAAIVVVVVIVGCCQYCY